MMGAVDVEEVIDFDVDFVTSALFSTDHRIRFSVTHKLFGGRIPSQFLVQPHGNIRQMAEANTSVV